MDAIYSSPSADTASSVLIHSIYNSMTATTTAQLQQTTVLLDSLHSSYSALLQDAKQQLVDMEVPEVAITKIVDQLKTDPAFKRALTTSTVTELTINIVENNPETRQQSLLINHIATQVGNQLGDALQVQLDAKLKEYLESGVIERAISNHITNNPELQSAIATKATLKQAFALAFDLDIDSADTQAE